MTLLQPKEYQQLVQENLPPRPIVKNMLWAFFVGGLICALGQVVLTIAQSLSLIHISSTSGASRNCSTP